jgi:hypothetical protein
MRAQLDARERGSDPSRYAGPERRRHRVYVTRNTEYHFRDGVCVAVRDRRTGKFVQGHSALFGRIDAGIKFFDNGSIAPAAGDPQPGDCLYFESGGRDLVTSPLEAVDRPSRDTVDRYPESAKSQAK